MSNVEQTNEQTTIVIIYPNPPSPTPHSPRVEGVGAEMMSELMTDAAPTVQRLLLHRRGSLATLCAFVARSGAASRSVAPRLLAHARLACQLVQSAWTRYSG